MANKEIANDEEPQETESLHSVWEQKFASAPQYVI